VCHTFLQPHTQALSPLHPYVAAGHVATQNLGGNKLCWAGRVAEYFDCWCGKPGGKLRAGVYRSIGIRSRILPM